MSGLASIRTLAALALLLPLLLLSTRAWAQAQGANAAALPFGLQLSSQVVEGWDSNILFAPTQPQADTSTEAVLNLSHTWAAQNWSFTLSYTPAGTVYTHTSALDYLSQSYLQQLNYAFTPHTQLTWSLGAQRFPERAGAPGMGSSALANIASASLGTEAGAVFSGAQTSLNVVHQAGPHTSWSGTVNYGADLFTQDNAALSLFQQFLVQELGLATAPASQSQYMFNVGLSWTRALSPSRSVVVGVNDSAFWFEKPSEREQYVNAQVSLQQRLGQNFTLQIGGGPAWSKPLPNGLATAASPSLVTYAANASLNYVLGPSRYAVSWMHSDQLGLTAGGLATDSVAVQFSMAWTRSLSSSVNLSHSIYGEVGAGGSVAQNEGGTFLAANLQYRLAPDWSVFASANIFGENEPYLDGALAEVHCSQYSLGVSFHPGGAR